MGDEVEGGGGLTVFHWQLGSLDDKGAAGVAIELLDHLPRRVDRDALERSETGDQHLETDARGGVGAGGRRRA